MSQQQLAVRAGVGTLLAWKRFTSVMAASMKVQTLLLDAEENKVNEQLKPNQGLKVPASERARGERARGERARVTCCSCTVDTCRVSRGCGFCSVAAESCDLSKRTHIQDTCMVFHLQTHIQPVTTQHQRCVTPVRLWRCVHLCESSGVGGATPLACCCRNSEDR